MKVVIFTNHPFPEGMAGTSRILAYCKGLKDNSVSISVLSTCPHNGSYPYHDFLPLDDAFNYWNAPFMYAACKAYVFRTIARTLNEFVASFRLLSKVAIHKATAVIFYGTGLSLELYVTALCKIGRIPSLKEESEYPLRRVMLSGHPLQSMLNHFFSVGRYRRYTGILAMTNPLQEYFLSIGIRSSRLMLVPHTVIIERFTQSVASTIPEVGNYLFFMGSLNEKKDGVLSCVAAFELVCRQNDAFSLVIAGDGTISDRIKLLTTIEASPASTKIHYIGRVSSYQIPGLLANAQLLVACRPPSDQAEYGFPTKIVEYLASGKPVVCTAHGDLTHYLVDEENAYLSDSNDPAALAARILAVLADLPRATAVGINGQKLAETKFNPAMNTKMIIDFIHSLQYAT